MIEQYCDEEVVKRVIDGETALYEIIIRRYNPYLFRIGRSYGYDHHDTEDIMQESYLSAYNSLQQFENRSTFKTWLVRIMLNHCFAKKQKSGFRNEIPMQIMSNENATPMFTGNHSDTGKTILNHELGHLLETAISAIPEDYRMVFSLRELNGMSTVETSQALNISEVNVKVRLNRARGLLRKEIEKMYSPDEIFEFHLVYCNRMVDAVMQKIETQKVSPKP